MCEWEEGAQNGICREAGCVSGRREHKMGFGGSRMCEWEGFGGRQDAWVGGREHQMGFGGRKDV